MLKQYACYFTYGFLVFAMDLFVCGFSGGKIDFKLLSTFVFSFLLFSIASAWALYNTKISAIIGIIGIVGSTPFAGFLIIDELRRGKTNIFGALISLCLLLSFLFSLLTTIEAWKNYNKPFYKVAINRYVKLSLALLPIFIIIFLVISLYKL